MPKPLPWLRLWDCMLDLSKAQRLSGETFKGWINLLMLANRQPARGTLPALDEIAFALRMQPKDAKALLDGLIKIGLVDSKEGILHMHDWEDWQPNEKSSAQRAHEWREEQKKRALAERSENGQLNIHRTIGERSK